MRKCGEEKGFANMVPRRHNLPGCHDSGVEKQSEHRSMSSRCTCPELGPKSGISRGEGRGCSVVAFGLLASRSARAYIPPGNTVVAKGKGNPGRQYRWKIITIAGWKNRGVAHRIRSKTSPPPITSGYEWTWTSMYSYCRVRRERL